MPDVANSTESLLGRTKKLLEERGELSLRQIAEGAGVGHEWLRSLCYGAIEEPGVTKLERVHNYLTEFRAAERFRQRHEPRAN